MRIAVTPTMSSKPPDTGTIPVCVTAADLAKRNVEITVLLDSMRDEMKKLKKERDGNAAAISGYIIDADNGQQRIY